MSSERRIRSDEHGLYVRTGGYVFRPLEGPTSISEGDLVPARHVAYTTTAKVGGERWWGMRDDPRDRDRK